MSSSLFLRILFGVGIALALSASAVRAQSPSAHLAMCVGPDEQMCDFSQKQFKAEYPKAYRRDYQAQRNIAFCLSQGCDRAVITNPILGCAWRMVIVGSGFSMVDTTDTGNLRVECGRLDAVERVAASAQAQVLMKKIYNHALP
ncbi:MAG: hypothetical protein JWM36_3205 [Hyphomicrobiales bacterium]|nr:hypothetical protein [Hyphomicrobiales bacterium]